MGYKNREIEIKLLCEMQDGKTPSMKQIERIVEDTLGEGIVRTISDQSADVYWDLPKSVPGDFVRLRKINSADHDYQLTVKATDRNLGNVNRVEVDITVDRKTGYDFAHQISLGGSIAGSVKKKYIIFFLDEHEEGTTVSCYSVVGCKNIFIEVEARSIAKVKEVTKKIARSLDEASIAVSKVDRSLYDIFVARKKMTTTNLATALEKMAH